MDIKQCFNGIYKGRRVLVTGHTGFKGSWLALWLQEMGADVTGYALEPNTTPNHFDLLDLDINSVIEDIRDAKKLQEVFEKYQPEIVFHLAAQPLVRDSYEFPVETLETNIMGTVNVLETCRKSKSVKAIINITSDKCYDNKEWVWGYRENDPMGGYDPYSASKGCAELVASSYRDSFFNLNEYKKTHNILLASCRAGNVIGGGDWSKDRLIPDIVKATINQDTVSIRSPKSTRPWEHVLEPLSGYLLLGQRLLEGKKEFAEGWNFGPGDEAILTVEEVINLMKNNWDDIQYDIKTDPNAPHEATLLKLDCSKAHKVLQWQNTWNYKQTINYTANWYKMFYEGQMIRTKKEINEYISEAKKNNLIWTIT